MLGLRRIATLDVSAASGLVQVGERLVVAADDEHSLAVYAASDGGALGRVLMWPGELPEDETARKRAKADVEALVTIDGAGVCALGSGSTPARHRGMCVPGATIAAVGGRAVAEGAPFGFDLAPLHAALAAELGGTDQLNLEGAAVSGALLRRFQRGNGPAGVNAVVDLDLAGVRTALAGGRVLGADLLRAIHPVVLPELAGVRLTFTDASPLPDGRIVFSAAAERSPSTFLDGECVGSAVGILSAAPGARVLRVEPLADRVKIEGIHARLQADGTIELLLVADADDRDVPSGLWQARLCGTSP